MASKTVQSVEPNIADLVNGWLKSYEVDYKLEQEPLSQDIDKALYEYFSKNGGVGGNRPDAKLLLQDQYGQWLPILIEYKGYKDRLEKLDSDGRVENKTARNEPNFKNINAYAVNGAVHYANAILHHTGYTDVIAIGVTGYKDERGKLQHSIGVYYVSTENYGVGQKIDEYTDLSFLKPENFNAFIEKVRELQLTQEELAKLKEKREREIEASLVKLNNDIFLNEKGLQEKDRVYLVASTIIATLGVPGKVAPLEKDELKSSAEEGNRDGEIIVRKITAFLKEKNLPPDKQALILRTLQNTLLTDNINKAANGQSQLKRVFVKIVDDLGIYYKIGLTTDFTGKLFNEMYRWLGFSQDKLNDVVLTPSYVATFLVKLARVSKDSYVWDFATGSAGLLVAAMNEMLIDAKNSIKSPDVLARKSVEIKNCQLLGLEILPEIYILAILNMILMGDGSSNILNRDSLLEFDGTYGFGESKRKFPADTFVLNPPYSAPGNGMVFVKTALEMMEKKGYAAIIIQSSAGSGKAAEYNKDILKNNTLLASIKMPIDLFIGKSSVQTNVYVFRVGETHQKDDIVRFIDFSYDGYTRSNRKKASNNLQDTDHAKERYQEVVDLVRFGKSKLHYLSEQNYYEGTIDPKNGCDWNQSAPIDTRPTLADCKRTVANYLTWEISTLLKSQDLMEGFVTEPETSEMGPHFSIADQENTRLSPEERKALLDYDKIQWGQFNLEKLFGKSTRGKRLKSADRIPGKLPFVTAGEAEEGVSAFIGNTVDLFAANTTTIDMFGSAKYRNRTYGGDDHITVVHTECLSKYAAIFVTAAIHKSAHNGQFDYGHNFYPKDADALCISLPITNAQLPDYETMETIISAIHKMVIWNMIAYQNKIL